MDKDIKSIEVRDLVKKFGDFTAVNDISFHVFKGEIFGFLGANGAGKTTAMRILCGLSHPTSGEGSVAGFSIVNEQEKIKKHIGYMSQKFSLYPDLKVWENIELFGGIYGLSDKQIAEKTESMLKALDMEKAKNMYVSDIPLGWKQKLAFSIAMVHEPEIVFLDEPTNGLDIPSKAQFRSALMKYTGEDSTIVISTHQVRDLENIIDPIIILDRQDVLLNASLEDISRKLYFDYGTQLHPESLYSEQLPGGFIQVYPNAEGADSKVNIEALFNAVHHNKEFIKGLFAETL